MSNLARHQPTDRFTGLSDLYARYRPGYPDAAVDFIIRSCGLSTESVLVDVGCGTGISSRLFAARGLQVIGIEPNADMRAKAKKETSAPGTRLVYQDGKAEATGLPNRMADAVLAAQAFHWFEPDAALREFHRILKPGGWVVLMWNERDETDPFTAAYGKVVRSSPEAAAVEGPRAQAAFALLKNPLFHDGRRVTFRNEQPVDEEGAIGRALSASYAPKAPEERNAFAAALREVFAPFQKDGMAVLRYETSVFLALLILPSPPKPGERER